MADLTTDAYVKIMGTAQTEKWLLDTSAAQTIYKGQPIILDISEDTTKVRGYVDATVVVATDIFIGIAAEGASVLIGAAETTEIEIFVYPTIIGIPGATFTDADVGDTMYMSDSKTLSATPDDNPMIGKLHRVKDGFQYVQLVTPAICTGA